MRFFGVPGKPCVSECLLYRVFLVYVKCDSYFHRANLMGTHLPANQRPQFLLSSAIFPLFRCYLAARVDGCLHVRPERRAAFRSE